MKITAESREEILRLKEIGTPNLEIMRLYRINYGELRKVLDGE